MMEYNKFIVAFASVIVTRLLLRWTGIDVAALGIENEFHAMITLTVDLTVASITSFFVWLVPNVKARLRDQWWWPWRSQ